MLPSGVLYDNYIGLRTTLSKQRHLPDNDVCLQKISCSNNNRYFVYATAIYGFFKRSILSSSIFWLKKLVCVKGFSYRKFRYNV